MRIVRAETSGEPSCPGRPPCSGPAGLIRVLLLDDRTLTAERLESALWMWPHRISRTDSVSRAIAMCGHLRPTAVVVALHDSHALQQRQILRFRHAVPDVPVIALAESADPPDPTELLQSGANAVLGGNDLRGARLYDTLARLSEPAPSERAAAQTVRLETPWRLSPIIGALISDIDGRIVTANDCLAGWLGYASGDALHGTNLWQDLLEPGKDWTPWKTVAGDLQKVHDETVFLHGTAGQILWMHAQVFAAPGSPTDLQVAFVDKTELAQLSRSAT